VKILFDANTPAPLARFLRGHEVVRADQMGWQGLENGALLDAAEQAGFDLLLTCDQNVRYRQNLTSRKLALVILSSNHLAGPSVHVTVTSHSHSRRSLRF
jgi:hypothetical protein